MDALWTHWRLLRYREKPTLRAEPRPVGRPLARSAWPFSVSGKLSEPQFKLHVGGVRSQERGNRQVQTNRTPCKPDRLQQSGN